MTSSANLRVLYVDAFTDKAFGGNTAGVVLVPYGTNLSEDVMQKIASELSLPMTAFVMPKSSETAACKQYTLVWFSPRGRALFCGHATLAAGHVIFNVVQISPNCTIEFDSPAGPLGANLVDGKVTLCLPSNPPEQIQPDQQHLALLGGLFSNHDLQSKRFSFYHSETARAVLVLLENTSAQELESLEFVDSPQVAAARKALGVHAAIFVAYSDGKWDSVARVFNIDSSSLIEDQVTGSAHTVIAPLFKTLFGKRQLRAHQCSKRKGDLFVELADDDSDATVTIRGSAVTILDGTLSI
ncbi:hypothetical protein GGI25_005253 [Coemansia spiralis]|uniref:Uncharacterized protein n=2 Tax=Coemansia TaxID=4863 RepID=A0A9W8G462_9FUNG|nr:hypothetical protein BX070DRAFT_85386 [Coemansia spiralis]KAJ1987010.1 hypothetical protein EDC05_006035 [Coemansia umbellata]KAJ2619022.1 hypothetical protein GGI26_006178 [Coemansia sp. RSA 1358]KAJ2672059.1 hypothetical protein GGI25_005253 [Coemansia spiralis]